MCFVRSKFYSSFIFHPVKEVNLPVFCCVYMWLDIMTCFVCLSSCCWLWIGCCEQPRTLSSFDIIVESFDDGKVHFVSAGPREVCHSARCNGEKLPRAADLFWS